MNRRSIQLRGINEATHQLLQDTRHVLLARESEYLDDGLAEVPAELAVQQASVHTWIGPGHGRCNSSEEAVEHQMQLTSRGENGGSQLILLARHSRRS